MRRTVQPLGPYALTASIGFLEGFVPAANERPSTAGHLHLAFAIDGREAVAAVCATQPDGADAPVDLEAVVTAPDGGRVDDEARASAAIDQLARILSLDADGRGYEAIGSKEPAIGRLQARYPGLRPVLFHSPYEAAAWTIIGTRISIRQASRVKAAMARQLGTPVTIHRDELAAFPTPMRLARLETFPGLFGRKPEYLRAIGEAANEGRLDIGSLRSMDEDAALTYLQTLTGIGPFGAELILLRGIGTADRAPVQETRLVRAVAQAYDRPVPSQAELAEISESWRPFRTWVTLLLRTDLEEETHEIRDGGVGRGGRPS
jgi:DNA-3-methyladenine glycosylase II